MCGASSSKMRAIWMSPSSSSSIASAIAAGSEPFL